MFHLFPNIAKHAGSWVELPSPHTPGCAFVGSRQMDANLNPEPVFGDERL
jgi:hypothetical protein